MATRIPVVDSRGVPQMPCTGGKARRLLNQGKAAIARNKLGVPYLRLKWAQEPDNQLIAIGVDPGSKWEGYSVVGTQDTVINVMCEARDGVKKKIEKRRNARRARRHRLWRRPARFKNRLRNEKRIPPSTRARWELKYRVIRQLVQILPLQIVVIEDVCAETRKGSRRWNASFSPVQQGKEHLYGLIQASSLKLLVAKGFETKNLRDEFGLKKTKDKKARRFDSHCVDSWTLAAAAAGAAHPTTTALFYVQVAQPYRRQLFQFQTKKDNYREPFGGTLCRGVKRGTLVFSMQYGYCNLGTARNCGGKLVAFYIGWNVKPLQGKWTTSYPVRSEDAFPLTFTPFRSVYKRSKSSFP